MTLLNLVNEGILEVYYGPMYSGKGAHIITRVDAVDKLPNTGYIAFKPESDKRTPGRIWSRLGGGNGISIPAIDIPDRSPSEVFKYIDDPKKVILFDEAQFFNDELVDVVESLLDMNKNVIIAGLNLDFRGEPFGVMPYFITRADIVTPLYAVCAYSEKDDTERVTFKCGKFATRTQRLRNNLPVNYDDPLQIIENKNGATNKGVSYEPRCRLHHHVPKKPKYSNKSF
jgi:thymidine kinase